jgi:hypothetical protein
MRVRFTADYDHVTPEKTTAFKAESEVTTTKDIGRAAVKARKAAEVKPESAPGGE